MGTKEKKVVKKEKKEKAVKAPNPKGAGYKENGVEPKHVDTSVLDKKSSPVRLIVMGVIIVLFIIWAFLVYSDYGAVKNGAEPKFCLFGKNETEEKQGTIKTCTGLGYKVVQYRIADAKMTEFIPIWQKNKTLEDIHKSE
jgi:hypothetical protein